MKIVLASGSPRRQELLLQAGITHEVMVSDVDETTTLTRPNEVVEELSCRKAKDIASRQIQPCIVIGADTVVSVDGEILGKPKDEKEAALMISRLQGRSHEVYTGVTLIKVFGNHSTEVVFSEKTKVNVLSMSDYEIRQYIACGESLDKAGAYGIQGVFCAFIDRIEGDYNNVVGLPVCRVCQELKNLAHSYA